MKKMSLDVKFSHQCGLRQHGEAITIGMGSEADQMPLGKAMSSEATENQKRVVNMKKQSNFSVRKLRTRNVQGQELS